MKLLTSRPNFMLRRIEPSFSILGPRRRDFAKAELDAATTAWNHGDRTVRTAVKLCKQKRGG